MKISDLRTERTKDRARVAATVIWEDCDRPAGELYFETDEKFAEGLTCNPESFLLASAIPAMHYGEKRVCIDAEVCPEFRAGLITAMSYIHHWFLNDRRLPELETGVKKVFPARQRPERAGFFFSGGIDSFATLRANRLNYPQEHPLYLRDGLIVHGLEMASTEAFGHVLAAFSGIERELGINLIPVYTNVYLPYREEDSGNRFIFWEYEFLGAALSSVAHAFVNRLSSVSISSTFSLSVPVPYGTHPLLDPNYSSTDLRIRHEGFLHTRLDKARLISEWDAALQSLRVCNIFEQYKNGALNCCSCEKCVRTMLEFMALGVLEKMDAFVVKEISPKLVKDKVTIKGDYTNLSYKELLAPLAGMGRHDLVRVIEAKMEEYSSRETNWKARLRQFDEQHLQGNLVRIKKALGQVI